MSGTVASLFSGIGGIELGFGAAGFSTSMFCEIDEAAQDVLASHFPAVPLHGDVSDLKSLPAVDVVTAGFPCQDLSQAGRKVGIGGSRSGLVSHLFRLIEKGKRTRPRWVVIENVPFMLSLDRGQGMRHLIDAIEDCGMRWAYRVVDARAFGLPQRRPRVLLVASASEDPRLPLLTDDVAVPPVDDKPIIIDEESAYGFYWTEGTRGLGWVRKGVPPIKGGSTIGIPSPPAIWFPKQDFVGTPEIRDAERLQGFPKDWTEPALADGRRRIGTRWRLVGNAVNVAVARWLGGKLNGEAARGELPKPMLDWKGAGWPNAACGGKGRMFVMPVSQWPLEPIGDGIESFLNYPLKPLSRRASLGFLSRARSTPKLVFSDRFLNSIEKHASEAEPA